MFCAECGARNEDSSRFCERCGAKLVSNEVVSNNVPDIMPSVQYEEASSTVMPNVHIKLSKWTVAILLEVIVLVILAYGVKWVGDKYYGTEYVAEKYFETIMEGDLGEAYEFLEVRESDFVSKKLFKETYVPESRGKLGSYSVKEESQDGTSATVQVTYRVLNESQMRTKEIVLLKKPDKKFLIFDDWKINLDEDMVTEFFIYAPQNTTVSLDSIILGKEYKSAAEDGYDVYQIPEVICGKHVVNATREDAQPVERNIEVFSNLEEEQENALWLPQLHLQKKVLQKISKNTRNVFKSIMDAKVKNTDTNFINKIVKDSEGINFTKEYYEYFLTVEGDYLLVNDIQVRAMDNSTEAAYYNFNGFYSGDYLIEAKAEVRSNCIYQDEYGYERAREVFAMFYYGYIEGKLSLLAVELKSSGAW